MATRASPFNLLFSSASKKPMPKPPAPSRVQPTSALPTGTVLDYGAAGDVAPQSPNAISSAVLNAILSLPESVQYALISQLGSQGALTGPGLSNAFIAQRFGGDENAYRNWLQTTAIGGGNTAAFNPLTGTYSYYDVVPGMGAQQRTGSLSGWNDFLSGVGLIPPVPPGIPGGGAGAPPATAPPTTAPPSTAPPIPNPWELQGPGANLQDIQKPPAIEPAPSPGAAPTPGYGQPDSTNPNLQAMPPQGVAQASALPPGVLETGQFQAPWTPDPKVRAADRIASSMLPGSPQVTSSLQASGVTSPGTPLAGAPRFLTKPARR